MNRENITCMTLIDSNFKLSIAADHCDWPAYFDLAVILVNPNYCMPATGNTNLMGIQSYGVFRSAADM